MNTNVTLRADPELFASEIPLVSITDRLGIPGSGDPSRVLHARVAGGFEVEVLPSRGFDLGEARIRGIPLSWTSPVRDARPLDAPAGDAWLRRFIGGLLTTCGLGNIGPATTSEGMHGTISHLPAANIHTTTSNNTAGAGACLSATVDSIELFGPSYRLSRIVETQATRSGDAVLRITDDIQNLGSTPAPLSVLYHLNLGAPLVVPGTSVDFHAGEVAAREENPLVPNHRVMPSPCVGLTEAVFDHRGVAVDAAGYAHAIISSPSGLQLDIAWSAATLPYAYQWVFPTSRRWALGIEPSTAPLFGAQQEDPHRGSPLLSPSEHRRHELVLTFSENG